MKLFLSSISLSLLISFNAFSQGTDGVLIDPNNGTTRDNSAVFQAQSTSQGFLLPRMTAAQRTAITVSAARDGLMVYQTDGTAGFYYYNGATLAWVQLATATGGSGYIQNQHTATQASSTFWVSGVGTFGDGTAALPSVTFNASPTTAGLFSAGANTIGFSTAATQRMVIDAAGNVSINTASIPGKLNVNGTAVIGSALTSRAALGITVSASSATTYAANADVGDGSRMLSIVNEGATANSMAILSMRSN